MYYLMAVPFTLGVGVIAWVVSGVRKVLVQPVEMVRKPIRDDGLIDALNDEQSGISLD